MPSAYAHVDRVPGPGEGPRGRTAYRLRVASLADGSALRVPAIVHAGRPTPNVAIVAGVHGDEVEGMHAVFELDRLLSRQPPAGSVLLVPIANPGAFRAGRRVDPADCLDLNRIFPGDPRGSVSLRLAAAIFEAVRRWSFVLSLHSWFAHGVVAPYVEVPAGDTAPERESRRVAGMMGLEFIRLSDWLPGLLVAVAVRHGIPAVEVEVGGRGRLSAEYRGRYLEIVRRTLGALGITDPLPPVPPGRTVRHHFVLADAGGYFTPEVSPPAAVRAGQRLGVIVDLFGRRRQLVRATADGTVIACREAPAVDAGDQLFCIFTRPEDHVRMAP